ncbi:MAG: hypothetical protein CMJ18_05150 [Phycisphaeraceae bacterium]|nr:hypothetical protein [Phycisphaeraceae bacterium]
MHSDPAQGRDDWEPVIAIVRGLLHNPIDGFCWERARSYVMADDSLMSQSFIHQLGAQRDARGVPILRDKLADLGRDVVARGCPLIPDGTSMERVCLEALACIGGPEARAAIDAVTRDPKKAHLKGAAANLTVADVPFDPVQPLPSDFPEVLRGVRSVCDVCAEGNCEPTATPEHRQRFEASLQSLPFPGVIETLSGDGETTTFRPKTRFASLVHDRADPFTDFAIYHSDPKIEYPIGRRRWAISHTYLSFQVIDGAFHHKEYTWNVDEQTITTHFHEPALEPVELNSDGRTVTVSRTPISTGIEVRGNVHQMKCTSAVRGVWDNPQCEGTNYYVRRANVLMPYRSLYYFRPRHTPVVNQYGIWTVDEAERPERFFDAEGNCLDVEAVRQDLLIPLHQPKILAGSMEPYQPTGPDDPVAARIGAVMRPDLTPVPDPTHLDGVLGARYEHSCCGVAGIQQGNDNGYRNHFDVNSDGVIDERDQELLAEEAGAVYRANLGDSGYFGMNWLSMGWMGRATATFDKPRLFVCSDDYGAGYDPLTGVVRLFETPPTGRKLYVSYHYDAPAAAGRDNIRLYLHPGTRT